MIPRKEVAGRSAELACWRWALTLRLHVGEFLAHGGQHGLGPARIWMRGTEDPPPSLDHVLHDGLGFEQVVACV